MPRKQIVELSIKKEKRAQMGGVPGTPQLTPYKFKPGVSGNPGGRPKGSGSKKISEAYSNVLSMDIGPELKKALGVDESEEFSYSEAIALQQARKAIDNGMANPSFDAVTELRETTEGKTPDKSEVAGAGGAPLTAPNFVVNFVKPRKPAGDEPTQA